MKNKMRLTLGFCAVAFGAVALAKDEVKNPHWFSDKEVQALVQGEPPPPTDDSAAGKADLQAELDAQKNRTPAQIAEAQLDQGYSVALFTNAITPPITPATDPELFAFFDRLNKQIGEVVTDSKEHFHRLRPYQEYPAIHSLFGAGGFSYPSGHATHSYAFAVILGQLFPDRAAAFLERARLISQSRVDAGVHYETDIREGEVLGKEIAKELMAKPAFMTELNAAKAELAAKK